MKRALPLLLATAAVVLWVACDSQGPTEPRDLDPSFSISDQAHGGTPHFYFLPPMVPQPPFDGTFIGTLTPIVHICQLVWYPGPEEYNCNPASGRRFGPGDEVEVDLHGQHYQVNWDTKEINPATGELYTPPDLYRITVIAGSTPLGHADVEILERGGGFQNLTEDEDLGEVVGLVDGRTLPIKFRIEKEMLNLFDIAFSQLLDSDPDEPFLSDVFLLDRATGARMNLTNSPNSIDFGPSWSPDGERIVFASNRDSEGGMDLYIMNADGSNPQLLVEDGWSPAWSPGPLPPDGKEKIAFQRGATPGVWDPEEQTTNIWVINADGSDPHPVTDVQCLANGLPDPFEDQGPAWRPGPFPSLTFSRNAIYGQWDPVPELPPGCASQSFDAVTEAPFQISPFDVVQVYNPFPKFLLNWTVDNSADDLGPVWSHTGQKLLYWVRTGDNELGIDDGDLWIMFIEPPRPDHPIPTRTPLQLTNRRGWISGASDWAPCDMEILLSWGEDLFDMGLYSMVPPMSPYDDIAEPVLLAPNAFGGKYRPGFH